MSENRQPDSYFSLQHCDKIEVAFIQISNASINRREFAEELAEFRKAIEEAIANIEKAIEKEEAELNILYNTFAEQTGEYDFIFKNPKIKKLIIDGFLQTSYNAGE